MTIESANADIARINKKLDTLYKKLERPTVANKAASIALYGKVIENFDNEGSLFGKWAPLQEATVKRKAAAGKEKMLVITGQLRGGFVMFHDEHNAGVKNEVTYAPSHQFGDDARNLPARNMLPPRRIVAEIGVKVYGYYIAASAKEANA